MTEASREDMLAFNIGLNAVLDCMRHTEVWWLSRGDSIALRRTRELGNAILTVRRKFFPEASESGITIAEALVVAEGLLEAARHCQGEQAALQARLVGAAETIKRLCCALEARP